MTIRKLWIWVIISVVVLSVSINAVILSSLTDRYFKGYLNESYESHVNEILAYTAKALKADDLSLKQVAIELETHLDDPIIKIKLYNASGDLLVDVGEKSNTMAGMMNGNMMANMFDLSQEAVDQHIIKDNGQTLGVLNITKYSSAENTFVAFMFQKALIGNSILSMTIALFISLMVGIMISKKMSDALKETAEFASELQIGMPIDIKKSTVIEINTIRESLKNLSYRLKIKQKNRKTLIDEMMHQSRTPLTVLKTHLEAFEDGILDITKEELLICQNQIDNVTEIISNLGVMIDATTELSQIKVEAFEFNHMIRQITNGLKAQFENKKIIFDLKSNLKITLNTDKYKLSQSIYNVLTNAWKYTNPEGNVGIDYYLREDILVIEIKDNGIGIDHHQIHKIFDAYYRGSVTGFGEGLGLYIVKENIEKINGKVQVMSVLNEGSNFVLEVPITYNPTTLDQA